jgi:hypothetical protein
MFPPNSPHCAVSIAVLPHWPSIVTVPAGHPANAPPPPDWTVNVALRGLFDALPPPFENEACQVEVVETLLIVQVTAEPLIDVGQEPVPVAPPHAIVIGIVPDVQFAVSVTLLPLGPVDGLALSEQPDGATAPLVMLTPYALLWLPAVSVATVYDLLPVVVSVMSHELPVQLEAPPVPVHVKVEPLGHDAFSVNWLLTIADVGPEIEHFELPLTLHVSTPPVRSQVTGVA